MLGGNGTDLEGREKHQRIERRETFRLLENAGLPFETRKAKVRLLALSASVILAWIGHVSLDINDLIFVKEGNSYIFEIAALFFLIYLCAYYWIQFQINNSITRIFEFSEAVRKSLKEDTSAFVRAVAQKGAENFVGRYTQHTDVTSDASLNHLFHSSLVDIFYNILANLSHNYKKLKDHEDLREDSKRKKKLQESLSEDLPKKIKTDYFESRSIAYHDTVLHEVSKHISGGIISELFKEDLMERYKKFDDSYFRRITQNQKISRRLFDVVLPITLSSAAFLVLFVRLFDRFDLIATIYNYLS